MNCNKLVTMSSFVKIWIFTQMFILNRFSEMFTYIMTCEVEILYDIVHFLVWLHMRSLLITMKPIFHNAKYSPHFLFIWNMQWHQVFEFMQLFHFHDMSENPLRCLKFIAVIILGVRMNAKVMKGSLALGNLLCVLSICYASFKLICICSLHLIWISYATVYISS